MLLQFQAAQKTPNQFATHFAADGVDGRICDFAHNAVLELALFFLALALFFLFFGLADLLLLFPLLLSLQRLGSFLFCLGLLLGFALQGLASMQLWMV